MSKSKLSNSAIYLLFFANLVYAVKNEFNWLFWIAAALTLMVFIFDVLEVLRRGK